MPNRHIPLRLAALVGLVAALLFGACRHTPSNKMFDPTQVAFTPTLNPLFDGQLYPSLILGMSGITNGSAEQPALFSIQLTSPADNAVLRVVVDSSALNYVTIIQEVLPARGQVCEFNNLSIKWKYDVLRRLRQPGSVDLTFTCYINDEEVDVKNLHLAYRTVNECPLSLGMGAQQTDYRWLFAAYVNEDHPYIEQILTDILEQGNVSRLSGYQGGTRSVADQVFAVWYYALERGIAYSSISCTSNPSPSANVQHIRFFDEVYNTRQANCIDACVFFASILRKIGLRPVIMVEPCHAYLGYYTSQKGNDIALLETTITSWVNFPDLDRQWTDEGLPEAAFNKVAKYLSQADIDRYNRHQLSLTELKRAIAHSLFTKASEYDRETFTNNLPHFADPEMNTYQQLDIEQLRQVVQPIN